MVGNLLLSITKYHLETNPYKSGLRCGALILFDCLAFIYSEHNALDIDNAVLFMIFAVGFKLPSFII